MNKKDKIEKLILNNRGQLNDIEPPEGHFERFEAKLNAQHKKKKIPFNVVLKIAAAIIFVLLVSNQAYLYFSPDGQKSLFSSRNNSAVTLASVSPKYGEVEFYFTNAINVGLDQWNELNKEGLVSEEEQKLMDAELAEFEERFKDIQIDLAANPNDKRVINAMLEYYRAKLNVINMIVTKLEEVKQKNNSYETNI
jgi:hypothetical protein